MSPGSYFYGVQFSTDGKLLIAHGYWTASNYFIVFDVTSGIVKSARIYSDGGYNNYNNQIRSMIISSGATPMGYLLSNY